MLHRKSIVYFAGELSKFTRNYREETMIEVHELTKKYLSHIKQPGLWGSVQSIVKREYKEFIAADSVSFSIAEGELVGMLGANGAGKTTTLKMLSGLLQPTSGTATVLGFKPWERKNEFRKNIALVMGQRNQLWWDLPAADSFLLNKEMYGISERDYSSRLKILTERLDITDKLHIQVRKLSLGERMKCELIGALLHYPKVVFLDEPTIGLDVVAQHVLREFIAEFNKQQETTIVLTSHYMEDIKALCKRVIVMDEGKIKYDGALAGLVEQYADDKILRIVFDDVISNEVLARFGQITEFHDDYVSMRIPRQEISTVTSSILQSFKVHDITISEMPVEDIIRTIFSNKTIG